MVIRASPVGKTRPNRSQSSNSEREDLVVTVTQPSPVESQLFELMDEECLSILVPFVFSHRATLVYLIAAYVVVLDLE